MTRREMHDKMDYDPSHPELVDRFKAIREDSMCKMIHMDKEILVVAVTEDIEDGNNFARKVSLWANLPTLTGKELLAGVDADKEHMLLVFPENTLTPKYVRSVITNLCERPNLKSAVVITKEAVILTDCIGKNVIVLTKPSNDD